MVPRGGALLLVRREERHHRDGRRRPASRSTGCSGPASSRRPLDGSPRSAVREARRTASRSGWRSTDVDLRDLSRADAAEVRDPAGADTASRSFPASRSTTTDFVRVPAPVRRPGLHDGRDAGPGSPDLNVITNQGRRDTTAEHVPRRLELPPRAAGVHRVSVPSASRRRAARRCSPTSTPPSSRCPTTWSARLDGRSITHVVTGLDLGEDDETQADHPIFRQHPISGRTALYLSTPKRCAAVSGMTPAEAERDGAGASTSTRPARRTRCGTPGPRVTS